MQRRPFLLCFIALTSLVTFTKCWYWSCTDNSKAVINGTRILVSVKSLPGKQVNCIFNCSDKCKGINDGSHYFEFKFKKGQAAVGVTTHEHFKPGNAIRGLFYDGNLYNGATKLPEDAKSFDEFGEEISDNDRVGYLVELSEKSMLVYIYHNKRSLGLAANFTAPYAKPLFPAICVSEEAQLKIVMSDGKPEKKERRDRKHTGIVGYWVIVVCENQDGKVVSTPNWKAYSFQIKPKTDKSTRVFNVLIKIQNEMSVTLVNSDDDIAKGNWTLLQGGLSLSGSYGEAEKAEEFLLKLFNDFETLTIGNNSMAWIGKNKMRMILKRRKSPIPSPLIRNPMQIGS